MARFFAYRILWESIAHRCTSFLFYSLLAVIAALLTQSNSWAQSQSPYPSLASVEFPISSKGVRRQLVILVDFPDQAGVRSSLNIHEQFFGHYPNGSLADYFAEVSYGNLILTGDVIGTYPFGPTRNLDGISYVRLPNAKSFYTGNSRGFDVNNFPQNMAGVFYHAILELEAHGFDFGPYVEPGTNRVEHVIVIFTGASAASSGLSSDFHASSYDLRYYFEDGFKGGNGYSFGSFTFCPETQADGSPANIGVCAHEIGHALGQPDLYDLTYESSGVGYYDLMGYGLYGANDGARPFHPSAPTKIQFGWIKPSTIRAKSKTVKLKPAETSPSAIKLIPKGGDGSEYFILENRQFIGFDSKMAKVGLCPGLYVWHVDTKVFGDFRSRNMINSSASLGGPSHPAISLVEADGDNGLRSNPIEYGECGDSWKVGQTWKDSGKSNARTWSGVKSGLSVKVEGQRGTTIELKIKTTGR